MPATTSARLLAAAGFALLLLAGGAGPTGATGVTVKATSPPYGRVGVVPDAVSVTFTGDITDDGAAVTVAGPGGGTFGARTEVVGDTLREYLVPGPAGDYTVAWAATGKGGEKLAGTFSFIADQAHAGYDPTPSPSPSPSLSPRPSPSLSPSPSPSPSPGPSPSPSPGPSPGPSSAAVPGSPTRPAGGEESFEVPQVVIPVGLAALLVAASGLVAATNRRRPNSA